MKLSLKERILQYLLKNHGFVASTQIERLVMEHTTYIASNASRRLRDLFEEGKVEKIHKYQNGKQLAFYKAKV